MYLSKNDFQTKFHQYQRKIILFWGVEGWVGCSELYHRGQLARHILRKHQNKLQPSKAFGNNPIFKIRERRHDIRWTTSVVDKNGYLALKLSPTSPPLPPRKKSGVDVVGSFLEAVGRNHSRMIMQSLMLLLQYAAAVCRVSL